MAMAGNSTTLDEYGNVKALLDALRYELHRDGYWIYEFMRRADGNGNSMISREELEDMISLVGGTTDDSRQTARALFRALDLDGDSAITIEELQAALLGGTDSATEDLDSDLVDFAGRLLSLPTLDSHCPPSSRLEVNASQSITDDAIWKMVEGSCFLEHVDFSRTQLSDTSLHALASNCPRLKVLSIIQCQNITDQGVQLIADKCTRLEKVNLVGSEVSSKVLNAIIRNSSSSLRAITLDGAAGHLRDETIELLVSNCPLLQEVDVACTLDVTTDTIDKLIQRCASISTFKRLRLHGECSVEVAAFIGKTRESQMHIITHLSMPGWRTIHMDRDRRNAVPTTDIGVRVERMRIGGRRQSITPAQSSSSGKLRMSRVQEYSLGDGLKPKLLVAG